MENLKKVHIFTDGACSGNPGPGGWGVILRYNDTEETLSGAEKMTTNNRMELMAAIKGLEALNVPSEVVLTTDSQYVKRGISEWIKNWKRKGWKNASNQPVKNKDLWVELDLLSQKHAIRWEWVRGHSGHPENEWADALARDAIDKMRNSN